VVELPYIDHHIPPPGERPENLLPRKRRNQREYRRRECEHGRHTKDCPPDLCPAKRSKYDRVTASVAGNADTRRDATRRDVVQDAENNDFGASWPPHAEEWS
jgi:hypothetical protein